MVEWGCWGGCSQHSSETESPGGAGQGWVGRMLGIAGSWWWGCRTRTTRSVPAAGRSRKAVVSGDEEPWGSGSHSLGSLMSGLASNERPDAPLRTDTFRLSRPDIVGGELPGDQYPVRLSGLVQHGFGRGGKDLGCPTGSVCPVSNSDFVSLTTATYSKSTRRIPRPDSINSHNRDILWVCTGSVQQMHNRRCSVRRRLQSMANGHESRLESVLQEREIDSGGSRDCVAARCQTAIGGAYTARISARLLRISHESHHPGVHTPRVGLHVSRWVKSGEPLYR